MMKQAMRAMMGKGGCMPDMAGMDPARMEEAARALGAKGLPGGLPGGLGGLGGGLGGLKLPGGLSGLGGFGKKK
jgi:signal recognition particle subunit SRP54